MSNHGGSTFSLYGLHPSNRIRIKASTDVSFGPGDWIVQLGSQLGLAPGYCWPHPDSVLGQLTDWFNTRRAIMIWAIHIRTHGIRDQVLLLIGF